jgi:hypothetical protein
MVGAGDDEKNIKNDHACHVQRQGDVVLACASSTIGTDAAQQQAQEVPFRMTRMLTTLISPIGLEVPYLPRSCFMHVFISCVDVLQVHTRCMQIT